MDKQRVLDLIAANEANLAEMRAEVETAPDPEPPDPEPPDQEVVLGAGDDLQAALDTGGAIALAAGASFGPVVGGYQGTVPFTLTGRGDNTVRGERGAALHVPLQFAHGHVETVTLAVTSYEVVCLLGRNDSSSTDPATVPRDITFQGVTIGPHVGKRAFEVNARDVLFDNCTVVGVYDDAGLDSQAIWIGNSPGGVHVLGGHFEAASECLMVGGDELKLEGNSPDAARPTTIQVIGAEFTKPLAWKDAGTPKVKNLFELKDGHDVLIKNCTLWHCWKSAQDGYAFMFTPTRGGSLQNVRVETCDVHDVGGIVNITGIDHNWPDARPRTQVEVIGGSYRTNTAAFPGSGRFCLITEGPEWVRVANCFVRHQGAAFIAIEDKATIDQVHVTNSDWNYGSYGLRIGGLNHGDNSLGVVKDLRIEGNTITGAHSSFRSRYPNNTYLASMTREREQAVDQRAAVHAHQREVDDELKRLRQTLRDRP